MTKSLPTSSLRIAGAVLALALLAAAPAAADVPRLDWRGCGDGVRCAGARVPLDHDRPHAQTITLALAKRPATDPDRRIGTLFLNPGGPGGSGVDMVTSDPPPGLAALNRRFDIVGFDPRGVGASRPAIDCVSDRDLDALVAAPPVGVDATLAAGERLAAGCRARTPAALLDHVSTADVARDLDLLRQAVGDAKLSYYGASYGTELGAVYATLFPGRTRVLALDGAVDPRLYARDPLGFSRAFARGNEAALARFFAAGGSSPHAYDALLARLAVAPIPGAPGDPRSVDRTVAGLAALTAMFDPELWGPLTEGLARAEAGDGAILQALADGLTGRRPDATYSNSAEAGWVIHANDSRTPRSRDAFQRHLDAGLAQAPHFADAFADAVRRALPTGEDSHRGPVRNRASAAPMLVVGSTHDNAAPYEQAVAMTRQLGNARLLTREGDGHTAYGRSTCIDRHVNAYLIDGKLPPAGTRCH